MAAELRIVMLVVACACGGTPNGSTNGLHNARVPRGDAVGLAQRADELLAGTLALDYQRPFRGQPPDFAPAIAAYLEACHAGDGRSCRRALALEERTNERNGASLRAVIEGCRAGQLDSCRSMPVNAAIAEDRALPGWAGRSQACQDSGCHDELRRECDHGLAASCYVLAQHRVGDADALLARARQLVRAGCRADIAPDCGLLGMLRESAEDDVLQDGYRCRLLGIDCVTYGLELQRDPIAARDVLERNCQYNHADQVEACRVLAVAYEQQLVPQPMPGRARAVHEWVCARSTPDHAFCTAR